MDEFSIKAISPIDGRYYNKCSKLNDYFSEYGLIRYRLKVEIDYFMELCKVLPELKNVKFKKSELTDIYTNVCTLNSTTLHYI